MAEDIKSRHQNLRHTAEARRQTQGDRWYNPYGETAYPYEESFRGVFDKGSDSFVGLLMERFQKTGRAQIVLDLMAPPESFLSKLAPIPAFGGGVAVTLGQESDPVGRVLIEVGKRIYVVTGDVFQGSIWGQIDKGLGAIGINSLGFDLAVCRAEGPLKQGDHFTPEDLPLLSILFAKAWERLNPDGGQIFTQLPTLKRPNRRYEDILDNLPRIAVENGVGCKLFPPKDGEFMAYPVVRFIRTPESPSNLARVFRSKLPV